MLKYTSNWNIIDTLYFHRHVSTKIKNNFMLSLMFSLLHSFYCLLKLLKNCSNFRMAKLCPITNPIMNPHPYPIIMSTQSNLLAKFETSSCLEFGGGCVNFSKVLHFLFGGLPHNSKFPKYELFRNVENCLPLWNRSHEMVIWNIKEFKEC